MAGGRPSKWKDEFVEQALKLARLGATDKEAADFFGVKISTITKWKLEKAEFSTALKEGKIFSDANVASSLYHRALGYSHEDVDIRVIDRKIVQTTIIKHYPPDTTAAIFWLKNRRPDKWRDKPVDEDPDAEVQPLQVTFNVKEPVGEIKVTNART